MKSIYFAMVITLGVATNASGQGCSDAGICSAPTIRATDTTVLSGEEKNTITASAVFGTAQYELSVFSFYVEAARTLGKRIMLSAKAGYAINSGPITTNHGFSDLVLTAAYRFRKITPMVGVKLPFNNANAQFNGLTLPMSYQASLGTTDILAGISYISGRWGIALAYQQPIVQNVNTFMVDAYPNGAINNRYLSTMGFERKADVIARAFYNIPFRNRRWLFTPGILPIFHVANDTRIEATGERREIPGSQGLTLNTNVALKYSFENNTAFRFTVGAPVMARKTRPEGLTKFAIIAEYITRF